MFVVTVSLWLSGVWLLQPICLLLLAGKQCLVNGYVCLFSSRTTAASCNDVLQHFLPLCHCYRDVAQQDSLVFSWVCLTEARFDSVVIQLSWTHAYMIHLVEMWVCVSLHNNLKTVADICFLLDSYVDWRKISDEFDVKVNVKVFFRRLKIIQ